MKMIEFLTKIKYFFVKFIYEEFEYKKTIYNDKTDKKIGIIKGLRTKIINIPGLIFMILSLMISIKSVLIINNYDNVLTIILLAFIVLQSLKTLYFTGIYDINYKEYTNEVVKK